MKRKNILAVLCVAGFGAQAFAAYSSIQHNAIDGTPDTNYVGGVLTVNQSGKTSGLTLNDSGISATPQYQKVAVDLLSTFSSYVPPSLSYPNGYAEFVGGHFLLTFDYRPTIVDPWGSYSIGGNITGFRAAVFSASASRSTIKGEGLFFDGTPVLPGSNDWPAPDPPGLSSIQSLTLEIGINLTGYTFGSNLIGGETQYTLFPNAAAAPEPTTLLILALGAMGLLRRRSV